MAKVAEKEIKKITLIELVFKFPAENEHVSNNIGKWNKYKLYEILPRNWTSLVLSIKLNKFVCMDKIKKQAQPRIAKSKETLLWVVKM